MQGTQEVHVAGAASSAPARAEPPRRLESKTPSSGLQQRIQAARRKEREAAAVEKAKEKAASGNGVQRG
jgi:hypothetical protein